MHARRPLLLLSVAALAIGTMAAPTAAAGATRWVDDDGKAGPTTCGGSQTAPKSIQKAIDAANAGDTVRVCPGAYTGALSVGPSKDGLTILADRQWAARIIAPDTLTGTDSTLLLIRPGADHVTVQGLVLLDRVTERLNGTAGTPTACWLDNGIWVRAEDATILADRVRATGETLGGCGLRVAVKVGGATAPAGEAPPVSALVSHTTVADFVSVGIWGTGPGTHVRILRDSVRYWHLTQGLQRLRRPAGLRHAAAQRPAGPGQGPGTGIVVENGASGLIYGNEVSSGPNALLPAAGPFTAGLGWGIVADQPGPLEIRSNTVHRAGTGIAVYDSIGTLIKGNVVTDHYFGIDLETTTSNVVKDNQVGPGAYGIYVYANLQNTAGAVLPGTENLIRGNTALGNDTDCYDGTAGQGTGTSDTVNTWRQNTGFSSNPAGLCGPDV